MTIWQPMVENCWGGTYSQIPAGRIYILFSPYSVNWQINLFNFKLSKKNEPIVNLKFTEMISLYMRQNSISRRLAGER
jgi:hypothetical protein